jgi:hypothetical protein
VIGDCLVFQIVPKFINPMIQLPIRLSRSLTLGMVLSVSALFLSGCSGSNKQEATESAADAYASFRTYVESVEADRQRVDEKAADFSAEMNRVKEDYNDRLAVVEREVAQMTETQKIAIDSLKMRYTTAYMEREEAYKAHVQAAEAAEVATVYQAAASGYGALAAADLRATFEQFVRDVKANQSRYNLDDWRLVNADWKALNARKELLEKELSVSDRATIAKEKIKYSAIKTMDKTEERTKIVGESIERRADKIGDALKNDDKKNDKKD